MGLFNFDKEIILYPRFNLEEEIYEIVKLEDEGYSNTKFPSIGDKEKAEQFCRKINEDNGYSKDEVIRAVCQSMDLIKKTCIPENLDNPDILNTPN